MGGNRTRLRPFMLCSKESVRFRPLSLPYYLVLSVKRNVLDLLLFSRSLLRLVFKMSKNLDAPYFESFIVYCITALFQGCLDTYLLAVHGFQY